MIQMNLFSKQKQRHKHREQMYDSRRGREGGINWETGTDIHTLLCIQWMAGDSLLYSMGSSARCSVVTWMGRKFKREGICVCMWLVHFAVQQNLARHCKTAVVQ